MIGLQKSRQYANKLRHKIDVKSYLDQGLGRYSRSKSGWFLTFHFPKIDMILLCGLGNSIYQIEKETAPKKWWKTIKVKNLKKSANSANYRMHTLTLKFHISFSNQHKKVRHGSFKWYGYRY